MKLKKLLKNIPDVWVKGSREIEVTGLCENSKCVAPGNLFVAKRGASFDGNVFAREAVAAGAVAIVSDIYDPFLEGVTQIIHPDVVSVEAHLAAEYYQHSASSLLLVGVTGTNGKTTTSYLCRHLLEKLGEPCGLIGTIEKIVGKQVHVSSQTTPDLLTNYKLLHEMIAQGCTSAVMEVSSHALAQGRVLHLPFDVAIFTNLTLDHLDYHQTMEKYAEEKAKLFRSLSTESIGIVNVDDPWTRVMVRECRARLLTYGIEKDADVRARDLVLSSEGVKYVLEYQDQRVHFSSPLIGRFNVYNCLAATALGLSQGARLEKIIEILSSFKQVSGRLERIKNKKGIYIFVDYAHTDDALRNVLETINEFKQGRLITVFGCGGNRDVSKRKKMGEVAEKLADVVIVTSDNPRNEHPLSIIDEIVSGFQSPQRAIVQSDRRKAIEYAIEHARPEDIVLIAGKGHERGQVFAEHTVPFDDREVAREIGERE